MEDMPAPQPQSNQIIQNLQNQINALSQAIKITPIRLNINLTAGNASFKSKQNQINLSGKNVRKFG